LEADEVLLFSDKSGRILHVFGDTVLDFDAKLLPMGRGVCRWKAEPVKNWAIRMIADLEPERPFSPMIWYVLQLKPNGLKIAQTNLGRQGYQTLMPLREISQQSKYGLQSVRKPLFPGYLFFGLTAGQIDWRSVANTRGVTRVVTGTAGQPAALPAEIVDGLIHATDVNGMLIAVTDYRPGATVSVINGPFAGWLAQVIAADCDGRIRLLIDLMGRKTPIMIAGGDVEECDQ